MVGEYFTVKKQICFISGAESGIGKAVALPHVFYPGLFEVEYIDKNAEVEDEKIIMAVASIVLLSIGLRQKGSPDSKLVDMTRNETPWCVLLSEISLGFI
ncbi:DUF6766 family protein [Epilithonimonas zeae]|uniref:DUF6766 family protein n=1 Tax=Epilithonimonas zeae TaxID=1416779 RepID=UPI000940E6FF|nr:DUF6766 family protein [Epilithonimonas zeae]